MERGASRDVGERVFEQILGFSGFGFPKAHAVAFGLLAYQSIWLRVHYGPELLCALFNEQPMGFYPPDSLAHEAQRRGVHGQELGVAGVRVGAVYDSHQQPWGHGLGHGGLGAACRALAGARSRQAQCRPHRL